MMSPKIPQDGPIKAVSLALFYSMSVLESVKRQEDEELGVFWAPCLPLPGMQLGMWEEGMTSSNHTGVGGKGQKPQSELWH